MSARTVVDEMFSAFEAKDLERIVNTFSEDATLIYHGTQKMPAAKFKGTDGTRGFFSFNLNAFEIIYFQRDEYIETENKIVVLGKEHFKKDGADLKNTWVQIYTVKDQKITRMEEFATSAAPEEYGGM
jgi:ketosteroid isomerase-like protein